MLKKASNKGIIVGNNNFYDQFFVPKREENIKITTYFDGAFWSGNAEALKQQKQKVMTLNGALDTLVHASRCRNIDCSYPDCQTIIRLLRHASRCSVRYAGGQICGDLNCKILRCKEMKNQIEKNASSSKKKQNPTTQKNKPRVSVGNASRTGLENDQSHVDCKQEKEGDKGRSGSHKISKG
nr:hypothetical protein [Tanacetum cinerariifolium]